MLFGVPQVSILGLLLNIFLCELFIENNSHYFNNYTDNTTPCVIAGNTAETVTSLTVITQTLFTCFANNQMKAYHHKCYLLLGTQDLTKN